MKISNLSQYVPGAGSVLVEIIQGYQSTWIGTVKDADKVPIDLTGAQIEVETEFYLATVTGGSIDRFVPLAGSRKRVLAVQIEADQAATPGRFTLTVPHDLYTAEIPINTDELPVAVVYIKTKLKTEIRIRRMALAFRRGFATDGPPA